MENKNVFVYEKDQAVAETKQGKVRGYRYGGVSIFKGIPYAKAKRFHAPQPAEPWNGEFDATSYGFVCPLLEIGKPNGELGVPHRYWVMNEDCLNLNVWTPNCDDGKRPVMVWLHGGGFEAGSAIEQVAYEGGNMSRIGNVVVVSINHRLNVLGYCDLSDFGEEYANSGNAGTDDMIAALRWVRDNIEAFGGDPMNVTLFGQSGGGAKITTLLQSPEADGLYHRGINMSGVLDDLMAEAQGGGKELGLALLRELSLSDVHELEEVPFEQLAAAYKKVKPALMEKGLYAGGAPYANAWYAGNPMTVGFREETADIPLLVGTVFGEFMAFVPEPYDKAHITEDEEIGLIRETVGEQAAEELIGTYRKAYPERKLVDLLKADFLFRAPTQRYIQKRSACNEATYSYLFNQDFAMDGWRTPWHCADIPYVFHNTELVVVTQGAGMSEALEEQIFEAVMAFARTGDPNHAGLPHWSASTPKEEWTMILDGKPRVLCNHDHALLPLLEKHMGPVLARQMNEIFGKAQH